MRTTQNERGQGGEAAVTTAVERRKIVIALGLAVGALFLALFARGTGPQAAQAASHEKHRSSHSTRPRTSRTSSCSATTQPGQQDKVALIMDVIPGEEPSSGPNYWNFDPNVLYRFSVDNNGDGRADDVELEFRFRNEPIRGIARQFTLPFSYSWAEQAASAADHGARRPRLRGPRPAPALLGDARSRTITARRSPNGLIAVPSNVGPRTMPDYAVARGSGHV